jgi:NAD(P)-dependent dehydrogenase (short-subunit alcohol dehydrogenase family)
MDQTRTAGGRLAGRRALITGAAGGIAKATALQFAAEGALLVLTDLHEEGAAQAAETVRGAGGKASHLAADVTSRSSVEEMMREADREMGGIDILVTCAGGYKAYGSFEDIQPDDWDRVIALNLTSVFLCCSAVLPYMKKGGWGRIINLGSLAGRSTSAGTSPVHYGAAKAGVSMMTQYLAKDVAQYGITANTIAPGTTKTDRVVNLLTPDREERFVKSTPVGYLAEPEDIASVITFLAEDGSRYITGATLDVNGGRLMLV